MSESVHVDRQIVSAAHFRFASASNASDASDASISPGIDTGEKYVLNTDMQVECFTAVHYFWITVGAVQVVVFGLGIPMSIAFLLQRAMREPEDSPTSLMGNDTVKSLGFIYAGYRDNCCYWEAFVMIRKAAVVCVVTFCMVRIDWTTTLT